MARQSVLHFFPERIAWMGLGILGLGFILVLPFIGVRNGVDSPSLITRERREKNGHVLSYTFSLDLKDQAPGLSIPDLQEEVTFSFDPPRPDGGVAGKNVLVRMKQTGESKRVVLPCRLDLEFRGDRLTFSKEESLFWIELSEKEGGQIEAQTFITTLDGKNIDAGTFVASGQDCPVQRAQEFSEGSPFRLLAEGRWWGRDQFRPFGESGERLEIGQPPYLEIREGDWLVWKEEHWEKSETPEKDLPIAHIQSISPKELTLEAWDSNGHTRIALSSAITVPFKMKGEELFTSLRVRSEKQISCMLEKQCMVLKTGDWVLKTGGRWKILRKKDERDAFLNGKLFGELFILDHISQKQGQKMIQGRLFNPGRTQMAPIEMAAQSARKTGEKGLKRGKAG